MSLKCFLFPFILTVLYTSNLTVIPAIPVIPEPDPTMFKSQTYPPDPSPPATIPAFPEQSSFAGCPFDLSEELYNSIRSACGSSTYSGQINPTHCCPVLAAWVYAAYSRTALHRATVELPQSTSADMPMLPDDSQSCVESFEKALENKGVEFVKPNETCDVVSCYCGIRLRSMSCKGAFWVNLDGELIGDWRVKRLEKDCLSSNGYSGLAGCSKCLNSLYLVSEGRLKNTSITEDRTSKMRIKDCQMMGLTWLLNKNTTGYIHTVSAVLRALMMSKDGSVPKSCTLNSDGLPLAVDSSEINDQSSATLLETSVCVYLLSFVLAHVFIALFSSIC